MCARGAGSERLRGPERDTDRIAGSGRLIFHIFAALAEFERALIRERTRASIEAARGRQGGRRK